ncbi:MAG: S8 family serine peptidase, partial [Calditrichaeota bacterium]|nr:S8 family serine peptidase [Calditrichota bacterium]
MKKAISNKIIFFLLFIGNLQLLATEKSQPQEIIVKINSSTKKEALADFVRQPGLSSFSTAALKPLFSPMKNFRRAFENSPLRRYFKIQVSDGEQLQRALANLQGSSLVESAELNRTFHVLDVPNDPRYGEQWYLQKIQIEKAWAITTGDSSVIVGVIDTGVDYWHEDLRANLWINPGEDLNQNGVADSSDFNGIDDDENGFTDDIRGWDFTDAPHFPDGGDYRTPDNDPADEHGHGTSVAGIIAATANNRKGIAGIAPACRVMALRAGTAQGYLEEDDVAAAIIYAIDNGAKIINMSFGDVATSPLFRDVMEFARQNNIVLIASAGNTSSAEINYPAALPQVISVGALNSSDALAGFSSYGATIDIVAPGVQLLTTAKNDSYLLFSGTSAAAPVVSGVAALIWSHSPDFSNSAVRNVLVSAATDLGPPGWDNKFGAGRVDAFRALQVDLATVAHISFPKFDQGFAGSEIPIIGTAAGAFMEKYDIFFGIGDNPTQWFPVASVDKRQIISDTLTLWSPENLPDTSVVLRLRAQNFDASVAEHRVRIWIDRTPPVLKEISQLEMLDGANHSQLIQFKTDDVTQAKLFYRRAGSSETFREIDLHYEVQEHCYNFDLPGEFEFYVQLKNRSGLTTVADNNRQFFRISLTAPSIDVNRFSQWDQQLAPLYLLNETVDFDNDGNQEFIAAPYSPESGYGHFSLFEFEGGKFQTTEILPQVLIPRAIGDINHDGSPEILGGAGPKSMILSGNGRDPIPREIVWADSGDCWASRFVDVNNDGNLELIVRKSGEYRIYEIDDDFQTKQMAELPNPTSGTNYTGVPHTEAGDFDNDGKTEILFGDGDGDIYLYEYAGNGQFVATWQQKLPLEDATNFLASGDFDGDGIPEFAAGCHSSSDLDLEHEYDGRYWLVRIFDAAGDDSFKVVWEQRFFGFADPADFASSFSSGDIDNDGDDELLLNLFPDFYVIDFDSTGAGYHAIGYFTPSRSHANLIADLDGNGENEFLLNTGEATLIFQDRYASQTLPPTGPAGFDAFPLDQSHVFLQWLPDSAADGYRIYRGNSASNLQLLSETQLNYFTDTNVSAGVKYFYTVASLFLQGNFSESQLSPLISVTPGNRPWIKSANFVPPNQLRVSFNEKMDALISDVANYRLLETGEHPRSAIRDKNFRAALLTFSADTLPQGNYYLLVTNVRDADRTPIDTTKNMTNFLVPQLTEKFYIQNGEFQSNGAIAVRFNLPVDENSALQKRNYSFDPPLALKSISVNQNAPAIVVLNLDKNQILPLQNNQILLTVQNICSRSGIPIVQGAGSQIAIPFIATSLSQAIIFPNPYISGQGTGKITFSNLIKGTSVKIATHEGRIIRSLRDENNNGTIHWDLKDDNGEEIASGVYVFFLV